MSAAIDRSSLKSYMPISSAVDQQNLQNLRESSLLQRIAYLSPPVNNPKVTIRELLQPSVRYDPLMAQNSLSKQSPSPEKNISTRGLTPEKKKRYIVWDDLIKDQIESGRRSLEVQKNEERLRKQLYKEDLDRLAKEQRRSKLIDRIDQINSYPEHNLESWKDFDQAYQQNQQIHKQKIRDSLDENYRLYMDKKYKIKQEKEAFDSEMLKKFEEAKKYEELARSIERGRKNHIIDEIKSDAKKHSQDAFEKEVKRIVADREYNQKETEIMIQKEKEAKLFYDKIRQQSLEKNIKGLEFLQQSANANRQGGHLRSLLERTRIEKSKLEEDEEKFYVDLQKQKENEHLMRMKKLEDDLNKLENESKEQELKKKFEDIRFFDEMKRISEIEQKKNYQSILDQQILERNQIRKRENELNLVEQQLMARKNLDNEDEFFTVPNGRLSHERQLQLKYIDKWLVRKPAITSEVNRGRRFQRDQNEHNYLPDNQNSFDASRIDRLRR